MLLTRLEPLRADCRVTRSDGIDLEALCAMEMRRWYMNLLCHGPLKWVPVADMADDCRLAVSDEGILTVRLPPEVIRPVSVELYGWERPAPVTTPDSRQGRMQANPFSRAGVCVPAAVLRTDGYTLELYSAPAAVASARIKSCMCVPDPGEDTYIFHEDALSSITPLQQ